MKKCSFIHLLIFGLKYDIINDNILRRVRSENRAIDMLYIVAEARRLSFRPNYSAYEICGH